jgi:glycerol kinase
MGTCVVCGREVDIQEVQENELFLEIFQRADFWGMDSLTEQEQIVCDAKCCSETCFYNMK